MSEPGGINIADEVARLTAVADRQLRATYAKLTPWQKTLVARHPDRPRALDYINTLINDFTPLAGDRAFADDAAVVGGLGRFRRPRRARSSSCPRRGRCCSSPGRSPAHGR